jgi:hypothetical protein
MDLHQRHKAPRESYGTKKIVVLICIEGETFCYKPFKDLHQMKKKNA